MLLEGLVGVVAAPHGRYIALSTYERDEWRIYVSFDDISRRRPRWWGRALTKKDLESLEAADPAWQAHIRDAWHGRSLQVEMLDYDTPDDDGTEVVVADACRLLVTLESGRVGWELPACTEAEAASISTRMIAHLSLQLTSLEDRAAAQQHTFDHALQEMQHRLDTERAKYRDLLKADRHVRVKYSATSLVHPGRIRYVCA
ncbi:hypothetical protein Malapachy_2500 [Malassezia pachydermatis]|uniref:Uncharacterized protein n=1 Tax=Malassezia pachydermatis TaxID=77020 RepID=A0A0M8MMW1_9BASI|nr:hypothetical protein Malapachy_2500 [Malassezia pachydermatis]KOS15696.1 hypothetical protein Malapachy_2500 [Malassezia pachydermatis]